MPEAVSVVVEEAGVAAGGTPQAGAQASAQADSVLPHGRPLDPRARNHRALVEVETDTAAGRRGLTLLVRARDHLRNAMCRGNGAPAQDSTAAEDQSRAVAARVAVTDERMRQR